SLWLGIPGRRAAWLSVGAAEAATLARRAEVTGKARGFAAPTNAGGPAGKTRFRSIAAVQQKPAVSAAGGADGCPAATTLRRRRRHPLRRPRAAARPAPTNARSPSPATATARPPPPPPARPPP